MKLFILMFLSLTGYAQEEIMRPPTNAYFRGAGDLVFSDHTHRIQFRFFWKKDTDKISGWFRDSSSKVTKILEVVPPLGDVPYWCMNVRRGYSRNTIYNILDVGDGLARKDLVAMHTFPLSAKVSCALMKPDPRSFRQVQRGNFRYYPVK